MADTSIEWSDKVWNPVSGCSRVSAGCDHCYAVRQSYRLESMGVDKYVGLTVLNKAGDRHFNGKIRTHDDALQIPLSWKKPCRIFVNSMSDLFHRDVPFEFIDRVFAVMALCSQHTFQILTKRPERMAEYLNDDDAKGDYFQDRLGPIMNRFEGIRSNSRSAFTWPLPNVWLGTSVENQEAADERIPHLLRCPAAVRFLSCEPLLGPIEFSDVSKRADALSQLGKKALDGIDWIIVGGESGHSARPMHPAWPRSIRDQCEAADVPFFFKQWGEWKEGSDFKADAMAVSLDGRVIDPSNEALKAANKEKPVEDPTMMRRVGKKAAGRLLDGVEHNAMPATAMEVTR